ncbi:MAG: HNH endonuclease [Brucella anthropi]
MSKFNLDICRAAEAEMPVERVRSLLDYESGTGHLRWLPRANKNFNSKYAGTVAGAVNRQSGAVQVQLSLGDFTRLFWAHRIAWAHWYGEWPLSLIDHRDGDNQNNRIRNLRESDGCGNGANRRNIVGEIPFKGVYQWKDGRFAAQIKWRHKWKWLGLHNDPRDAARAYDKAALELQGEFAVTNRDLGLFLRPDARELL